MRVIGVASGFVLTGCSGAADPAVEENSGAVPTLQAPMPSESAAPAMVDASEETRNTAAAESSLPTDVRAFRERRDACDHFRGEEPYDAERAAFLSDALDRTCTGTDAALKDLRARYAGDPRVLAALVGYEDAVE